MTETKISQAAKDLADKLFAHCDPVTLDTIQSALTAYGNSKLEEAAKVVDEIGTFEHRAAQIRALKEKLSVEDFMEKQFADPETRAVYERLGES